MQKLSFVVICIENMLFFKILFLPITYIKQHQSTPILDYLLYKSFAINLLFMLTLNQSK